MRELTEEAAGRHHTHRQWSQNDLDLIRSGFRHNKNSELELAKALGARPAQIAYQVNKMGIRKPTDRRRWTKEEDDVLRTLIPKKTASKVAKTMNRSLDAVTVRAKRLGINRREREGWYTQKETSEILGKDHKWLIKRIENGSLKATRHHMETNKGQWHIEQKDLRDFIRKYPDDLAGRNVDLVQMVEILTGIIPPEVR